MINFVRFRPDNHYGYPQAEVDEKFILPYTLEKLLEFYLAADCSSPNMNEEYDDIEGQFMEWGNSVSFHTTYIIESGFSKDELLAELSGGYIEIGLHEIDDGQFIDPSELGKLRAFHDYNGIILNNGLGNAKIIAVNMSKGTLAIYKDGKESLIGPDNASDIKNLMHGVFDSMDIENLKELASTLYDSNDFGIIDYLKDSRGFNEDDLNDLKVMARMKKRSKYT
jgi:hypothetical protein